jgi:glycosyltransferase involved in cell wall biosynthesis
MKVAIVYDWLNAKSGGGESMLFEIAALYPKAPVYTLLHNPEVTAGKLDDRRLRRSFLQRLPRWLQRRTRYLLPLIPLAVEQYDLSEFDVVISVSSGWSKGVITRPETLHLCYCFSPMRFVWDYWPRYVDEQGVGPIRRAAIYMLTNRLRLWDFYSAARVDRWVAISATVAQRLSKYYHQTHADVIYPGVELDNFTPVAPTDKQAYFVTLASLTPYKRIDLAIAACNQLQRRLVIIGDGPDRARLERIAGPTIEFAGRVSDERRTQLLTDAAAMLFPNEEDFGISPLEAMASGTPVIAYRKGGATETVVEGKTGRFFDQPTPESLAAALKDFRPDDYHLKDLVAQASRFKIDRFRQEFPDLVARAYAEFQHDQS